MQITMNYATAVLTLDENEQLVESALPIQGRVSYVFKCPPDDRTTVSLGPSQ